MFAAYSAHPGNAAGSRPRQPPSPRSRSRIFSNELLDSLAGYTCVGSRGLALLLSRYALRYRAPPPS